MSKRAKQRAEEAYPTWTAENMGAVKLARHHFQKGYIVAEKDFAELLKERIKTWESIYDENEQFGIDNEQTNAVLEELKALLQEYEKDNTI